MNEPMDPRAVIAELEDYGMREGRSFGGRDSLRPTPSSPTLASLEAARRPIAATVCEHCPHSVWFASPVEVKCYCRVMYLITWSSREPQELTACDGPMIGQD